MNLTKSHSMYPYATTNLVLGNRKIYAKGFGRRSIKSPLVFR